MVPSTIERVERLPATPNGKLDRRALRERAAAAAAAAPEPRAPIGRPQPAALDERQLEAAVADAWRRMAGIPSAGLDDNFFERGGSR